MLLGPHKSCKELESFVSLSIFLEMLEEVSKSYENFLHPFLVQKPNLPNLENHVPVSKKRTL